MFIHCADIHFTIAFRTISILFPYAAPYLSSKFAVEAFSDSLRIELKPWKVGVHLIEPTFYKTEIMNKENARKSWMKIWNEQPQYAKDEIPEDQVENRESYINLHHIKLLLYLDCYPIVSSREE